MNKIDKEQSIQSVMS